MPYWYGQMKINPAPAAAEDTEVLAGNLKQALKSHMGDTGGQRSAVLVRPMSDSITLCCALFHPEGTPPDTNALSAALTAAGAQKVELQPHTPDIWAGTVSSWFFTGAGVAQRQQFQEDLRGIWEDDDTDQPPIVQQRLAVIFAYQVPKNANTSKGDASMANNVQDALEKVAQAQPEEKGTPRAVRETLETVASLTGAREFKEYINELEAMRTHLLQWRARASFPNQHLLFAVDTGSGCTTSLRLLHQYLGEAGLFRGSDKTDISAFEFREDTFRHSESLHIDYEKVLDDFESSLKYTKPGVMGIHIETWLNNTESDYFVRMLELCWQYHDSITFVFIVPFLDEGALARIHARLADVMNVRLLRFPPFTDEELISAAQRTLFSYDIGWDPSADKCFKHTLAMERSDQRFYGMQTIAKLSTELLLMKTRNNALKKTKAPENLLTEEDFKAFYGEEEFDGKSGFEKLDALIGLEKVKTRVRELVASVKAQKKMFEAGVEAQPPCYHMMFTGSPGTGKTIVARIIGQIFRENGLLPVGDLLEVGRWDMVGEYIGQTGPKTVSLCRSAYGSVMFIDEAYLLDGGPENGRDFGREAIGALIAEMENGRDRFVVIMAGYEDDMENLLKINSGLKDRIPHKLHFESYNRDQLFEIFKLQLADRYDYDEEFLETARAFFTELKDEFINAKEFGNGRFVRNLTERVRIKALLRRMGEVSEGGRIVLQAVDFEAAISDEDMQSINKKGAKLERLGFGG